MSYCEAGMWHTKHQNTQQVCQINQLFEMEIDATMSVWSLQGTWKDLHKMISSLVYKFTCVIYASKVRGFRGFHPRGRGASRISSTKGSHRHNSAGWLWDLWWDCLTMFIWQLVSSEECSTYVATLWVGTICCCDCCNYTQIASFSWRRARKSISCFCCNATIFIILF